MKRSPRVNAAADSSRSRTSADEPGAISEAVVPAIDTRPRISLVP